MKKIVKAVGILLFSLISFDVYALYPDKDGYNYRSSFADIYVGMGFGANTTRSWDREIGFGFDALFMPHRMLAAGNFGVNLGVRLFQDNPIGRNFRMEVESNYVFVHNDIMYDRRLINTDGTFSADSLPAKGQEVLKKNGSVNLLYDVRHFSQLIYPYFGAGLGYGQFKIISFDVHPQLNGLGEQYMADKVMPYQQLIIGVQYDTKIIKSSTYLQYKVISTLGKIKVTPFNNGVNEVNTGAYTQNVADEEGVFPPCSMDTSGMNGCPDFLTPTTFAKSIQYINHGITFGFRYYLY